MKRKTAEKQLISCKNCMFMSKDNIINNAKGRVESIFVCRRYPQTVPIKQPDTHWCGEFTQSRIPEKYVG